MSKTILDLLEESVEKYSSNPFLWEKLSDKFEPTTYKEVKQTAQEIGAGLMGLGLEKGEKVALLSEGRNAWIIGELGILYAGGVNVPLSIKLEDGADLVFRLNHSEAKMVMVSGTMYPKIAKIKDQVPLLDTIIVFDEIAEANEGKTITLNVLIDSGREFLKQHQGAFKTRRKSIRGEDYANISYTSGTTSDPKGILLTHRNYTANVEQAYTLMDIKPQYKTLLILPLDHCFAHVAGFYSFLGKGASVATVQVGKTSMQTLKNIPKNILEIQPDLLLSVPALSKNFKKNIEASLKKKGGWTEKLFNLAMKQSIAYNKLGYNKGGLTQWWKWPLLKLYDKVLFSKIREAAFGKNLKLFVGGGALLGLDLQQFFYALGVPIMQGYGLSEATPIISSNSLDNHILGSSGHIVKPMEIKICNEEGESLPFGKEGEILIRGENVMAGYWKNEVSTAQTVVDGWLHTGDLGYRRDKDFLYVVGRFKSLLIAQDGEKYSPESIEEALVEHSPYISQVMLHNDQNPYTVALVVPNIEQLKREVKRQGGSWESPEGKALGCQLIQEAFEVYKKGGARHKAFPVRWLPASVGILPEPFSEQNHQINSTMKMVRSKIEQAYGPLLEYLMTPESKNMANERNISALGQY